MRISSESFSSVMLDEARWSLVEDSLKTSWDLDKTAMSESIERSMGSQGSPWSSPQDNLRLSGISYPRQVDPVAYGLSIREIQRIISQLESHRSPRELMAPEVRRAILVGCIWG